MASENCVFCAIVAGDIPATKLREDDATVVFADMNPQAPIHVLVVPKQHLSDIGELGRDRETAAAVLAAISAYTAEQGIADYRTIFNTGAGVGQSVFHVHAHVMAGRSMGWPPS